MTGYPPFLVEKAAALAIEDAVPLVLARRLDARKMSGVARCFRRVAIARLLQGGVPDDFFAWLSMGGRCYLHWLQGVPDDRKVGSLTEPFLDAVACGDDDLAAAIARAAAPTWTKGVEYEEDFLYLRWLMDTFGLGVDRAASQALLERYEKVSDGADPRAALCRAILSRDQAAFDDALQRVMDDAEAALDRQRERGMLSADDAATTAQVSVELLALLRLAERSGLTIEPDLPLAASVARRTDRARLPPPGAWRNLPSPRQLG